MIINMTTTQIKKVKDKYKITLGDESVLVTEETVLKFRLFNPKELDNLDEIKKYDLFESYKNKAISYQVKYAKNSKEVINYLLDKGLDYNESKEIVDDLINKKILNDQIIANNLASSLARNSNGLLMIKMKLKNKLFDDEVIDIAISQIAIEDYNYGLEKIIDKANNKYSKLEDDYIRRNKIKEYLYRHGYVGIDI